MHIRRSLLLAVVLVLGVVPVLAQEDAKVQERRQEIDSNAQATLDELINAQAGVRDLYGRAAGYAVFTVTKGGFIVSGGGGNGVAVNKATGQHTYMRMGTGGIGLGIGGQRYSLVILFETEDRLDKFVAGGWDSSATAEAVAGKKASRFARASSTGSRSTRSLTRASWAGGRHRHEVLGQRRAALASQPEQVGRPIGRPVLSMGSPDPLDFFDVGALLDDDERLIRETVAPVRRSRGRADHGRVFRGRALPRRARAAARRAGIVRRDAARLRCPGLGLPRTASSAKSSSAETAASAAAFPCRAVSSWAASSRSARRSSDRNGYLSSRAARSSVASR